MSRGLRRESRVNERGRLHQIRPNLEKRELVYQNTRLFFKEKGFMEVETPVLTPELIPESEIMPFRADGYFLATSPEIYMKRLLAAGYQRIFQISHVFRKKERGRYHNPEFTLLEWYRAGGNYRDMLNDAGELVLSLALKIAGSAKITYQGEAIDLSLPWAEFSLPELFQEVAGWDPSLSYDALRFDDDLALKAIPALPKDKPSVLIDYPAPAALLAHLKNDNPALAERAEVFIGQIEIANAYSELTNPEEQRRRFLEEITRMGGGVALPQKFIDSLSYLPASGGIALGMDRLVMLFCDAATIDEVIAFPLGNI